MLKQELPNSPHAKRYLEFIEGSKRGVARVRISGKDEEEADVL